MSPSLSQQSPFLIVIICSRQDVVLWTAASRLSGQPVRRSTLAPFICGATQLPPEPHRGQTHREDPAPRRVQPLGHRAGGLTHRAANISHILYISLTVRACLFPAQLQLSVGAVQSFGSRKPGVSKRNFHGCLENLLYNGHHLIKLVKHKDHQVTAVVS